MKNLLRLMAFIYKMHQNYLSGYTDTNMGTSFKKLKEELIHLKGVSIEGISKCLLKSRIRIALRWPSREGAYRSNLENDSFKKVESVSGQS